MASLVNSNLAEEIIALVRMLTLYARQTEECPAPLTQMRSHLYQTLYVLYFKENYHLTMSQLAEELLISKQQLSKLVGGLEEKGLVSRHHDEINRRQVHVQITAAGIDLLQQQKQLVQEWIKSETALYYSEAEQQQMRDCVRGFHELMQKRLERNNQKAHNGAGGKTNG